MDYSDDISEESPCFIVPDSQTEVSSSNGALKELAMLTTVTPSDGDASDPSDQAEIGVSSSLSTDCSTDSVYPNSTTSSDSSKEELDKKSVSKVYPMKKLLLNCCLSQEDLFPILPQCNKFLTSTPMLNPGSVPVATSYNVLNSGKTPGVLLTPSEVIGSGETFECLQLSGEIIKARDTSSSEDHVSPTITNVINLKPTSPSIETGSENNLLIHVEGKEQGSIEKHQDLSAGVEKIHEEEVSVSEKNTICQHRETSLPKWQQVCIQAESETTSSVNSVRTTYANSTHGTNSTTQSSDHDAPSLHQWQSPQNGSDELFENEHSSSTNSTDLQAPELPNHSQSQHPKGLQLPELSQDIFRTKRKGTEETKAGKAEPIPTEILSSQDDTFILHLTQSNSPPIVPTGDKMDRADKESEPLFTRSHSLSPSQSILPQTSPTGRPPCEENKIDEQHHGQDILKDKGTDSLEKNENAVTAERSSSSCELVPSPEAEQNLSEGKTNELLDERREAPMITDDVEQMTESTESGQVAFHFSPPAVLLRPLTITPYFETNSESQKESLECEDEPSPPEICSTSEFFPVLPEVLPKTLSLSAPVLCDESTEDSPQIEFNLQKIDFIPDTERRNKVITKPARTSVFTNVRRFQAANENRASDVVGDGWNPFAFTDEVSGSPLRKNSGNKRKRGDIEERVGKRKRTEISEDIELDKRDTTDKAKRKFWKIVKTRTIRTTTTMIEREVFVKYTDTDGNVLRSQTITHEFDEPTYDTKAVESEETTEEVEDLPPPKCSTNKENETSRKQSSENTTSGERVNNKDLPKDTRDAHAGRQRSARKSSGVCVTEEDLREGSRVLALWFDKHYYPGTLKLKDTGDSRCRIEFDDGDVRDIQKPNILRVDYLPRDQPVLIREEHGDCYDNGVIRGFYRTRHERGYKVAKGNGKVQNCPRSKVILNTEQAAIFLSLRNSSPTNDESLTDESEPVVSPISSESHFTSPDRKNDVRSSSRTRSSDRASTSKTSRHKSTKASRTCKSKPPTASRTSRDSAKTSTTPSDKAANSSEKNTRQKGTRPLDTSVTPKSSHKSTSRKFAKKGGTGGDNCGNEDEGRPVGKVRRRLSCAMSMTADKARTVPTRTSPRKLGTRGEAQINDENLILPTNHDLFRGYGFVITGSDANSVACGDDDSPREEDSTFNRNQVRRQVEAGGGVVLPTFHEDPGDSVSYVLLSNSCQTTAKYFHALVVGVPCLSHVWLRDCCSENKLIGYKNYLLPAGRDLVTGKLVEQQACTNALMGLKVCLVGDCDFIKQWKKVLGAAQCEIVDKLPTNVLKELQYGNQDFNCDVIVVGSGVVSHSTICKARLLAVPTMTIHWVKQCILTNNRVSFEAHPTFRHIVN